MVWWYEHLQIRSMEKLTGGIPRFHNWKLDGIYTRKSLQKMLDQVPIGRVKEHLITPTDPEKIIYPDGFKLEEHVQNIKNDRHLCRFANAALLKCLVQLAPTFSTFRFEVCDTVMSEVRGERVIELDYSNVLYGDVSPTFERLAAEFASLAEKNLGIHWNQRKKKKKEPVMKQVSQSQMDKGSDDSDFEDRQKIISSAATASQSQASGSRMRGVKLTARKRTKPPMKKSVTQPNPRSSPTRSSPRLNKSSTPTRESARFDPAGQKDSSVHDGGDGGDVGNGGKKPENKGKKKIKKPYCILDKVPYSVVVEKQDGSGDNSEPEVVGYNPPRPASLHIYVETLKYSEWWSVMFLANTPPQSFDFPESTNDWSPSDGLFSDPGGVPLGDKSAVIKDRQYPGRENASFVVTELLNYWVGCLWSGHFTCPKESSYYHHKSGCNISVHEFGLLVYGYSIDADVVNAMFSYMQRNTPVDAPWFFVNPYIANMIHSWNMTEVVEALPYVFCDSFNNARWAFMPMIGEDHFVLLAADIHNVKLMLFNSLGRTVKSSRYEKLHKLKIQLLKQFLRWRMDNEAWNEVPLEMVKSIPKQDGSLDCGIFVLRYAYCLLNDIPMDFTQEDITKDRLVMAYKLLSDEENEHCFTLSQAGTL